MYGITMLINSFNKSPITLNYVWMNIVNLLFAMCVIGKASYEGKVLREKQKK